MTLASHYLIFDLNQCRYGVTTSAVQEIFFLPALIPVAEAPPDIVGILNLRGEILPVIDLNRRFGRLDQLVAGVAVDEVLDVIYVDPRHIQPIPAALHTGHDEFLEGIAPYYDQSMGVLDLPKVFLKGNLVVNEEV